MNNLIEFRQAKKSELHDIWEIIQFAIEQRKLDGSTQWQNGYPNIEIIREDLQKSKGFVLTKNKHIALYVSLSVNDEEEYEKINGKWLSYRDYLVFHRIAIHPNFYKQGMAHIAFSEIETYALHHQLPSIKVDTNFDNLVMIHLLDKHGYTYCGEVSMRGEARRAYEKLLFN